MTGPCHTLPRPLATPARIDGQRVYRCTECDRTWPLAHGPLGHPRT